MPGRLTHSPADIIAELLMTRGFGSSDPDAAEWPVFVGVEPQSPNDTITCYDFAGNQHGRTNVDGERQEHHGVQIRVRGRTHRKAYSKIEEIARYVDQTVLMTSVMIDSIHYNLHSIKRSGIIRLGLEPTSKLSAFVINCQVSVRECG